MRKMKEPVVKKVKKIKKPKPIKIDKETVEWKKFGNIDMTYDIFKKIPKDLVPEEEDIGKILEVAGNKKETFKLLGMESNGKAVLTLTPKGFFKSFRIESVILHRNEIIRDSEFNISHKAKKKKGR